MSDKKTQPTISVTRGRKERPKKEKQTQTPSLLPDPMQVVSGVAQGARSLWLAGLGAVSMAEDAGTKAFNALVDEGKSWEQTRRERTAAAARRVKQLRDDSTQAVGAVEERVRAELDDVLERVGVPSQDDMDTLRSEVNALSEKVERLAKALQDNGSKKTA